MGLISNLLKLGLAAGAAVTVYQALEKTKAEGPVTTDKLVRNLADQAVTNTRKVVDTVKEHVSVEVTRNQDKDNSVDYVDHSDPAKADEKKADEKKADEKKADSKAPGTGSTDEKK